MEPQLQKNETIPATETKISPEIKPLADLIIKQAEEIHKLQEESLRNNNRLLSRERVAELYNQFYENLIQTYREKIANNTIPLTDKQKIVDAIHRDLEKHNMGLKTTNTLQPKNQELFSIALFQLDPNREPFDTKAMESVVTLKNLSEIDIAFVEQELTTPIDRELLINKNGKINLTLGYAQPVGNGETIIIINKPDITKAADLFKVDEPELEKSVILNEIGHYLFNIILSQSDPVVRQATFKIESEGPFNISQLGEAFSDMVSLSLGQNFLFEFGRTMESTNPNYALSRHIMRTSIENLRDTDPAFKDIVPETITDENFEADNLVEAATKDKSIEEKLKQKVIDDMKGKVAAIVASFPKTRE